MLELSSSGAKVSVRAVESKFNLPLRVLSSFEEGEGTLVQEEKILWKDQFWDTDRLEATTIKGVPDVPDVAEI